MRRLGTAGMGRCGTSLFATTAALQLPRQQRRGALLARLEAHPAPLRTAGRRRGQVLVDAPGAQRAGVAVADQAWGAARQDTVSRQGQGRHKAGGHESCAY